MSAMKRCLNVASLTSVMRRLVHRDWKRAHVAMLLGCTAAALFLPLLLTLTWPELIEPLELWTVDVRFQHRPPLPVSRDPLSERSDSLVAIDYDDLAAHKYKLGRWPWDRRVHAQLINLLKSAGTQTLMVDMLFEHAAPEQGEDEDLAEATRSAGFVLYPIVFNVVPEQESTQASRSAAARHLIQAEVHGAGELPGAGKLTLPLPALVESAAGLGHIFRTPDRGGVLRRMPLLFSTKGGFVPALSLAAAFRSLDVPSTSVRIERGHAIRFKTGAGREVVIPIDASGRTWINYAGSWGTRFLHYPYSWMLDQMRSAKGKAQLFNGLRSKTVLLTNLTTGLGDRVATPFDPDFPTSEVHLHLLNMLLSEQFLRDPTAVEFTMCVGIPIVMLTAVALTGGPGMIMPAFGVIVGIYLLLLQTGLNRWGVLLPATQPIASLTFGVVLLLMARLFLIDRERARFQTALGACLPPQTIQLIKESPERITNLLAGHHRELTVLFADIQGFSAFCKRADPLLIQRVLREFLTPMTTILREYGGTLNKYMGDGVMAFFGDAEPEGGGEDVEEERVRRHAANAVRAGLQMQKKMAELNVRWLSQGQDTHLVRIGINTGIVTIGNLGTEYLWDYTVIGPEVNKTQRLEGGAQPGGLLLARRTYALARREHVLPDNMPTKSMTLKGIGEETDLCAVPPEMIDELIGANSCRSEDGHPPDNRLAAG